MLCLLLIAITAAISVQAESNCDNLGTLVYEDLSCKPVKLSGEDCPSQYDCDSLEAKPDTCLFRTRTLASGEAVNNDLTYGACHVGCFCSPAARDKFTCAILDCPEWLHSNLKPGCYRTYEVNKCCSTGQICPPFNETTCNVDDRVYKIGERFTPKDSCLQCVCKEGFDGKLEEPFCQRPTCAVQITHAKDVESNCAPYYSNKNLLCCPDSFVCSEENDKIIKISKENSTETDSDLKCKFGKETVKLGFGIEKEVDQYGKKNVTCECKLPPLLTCLDKA